MKQVMHGIHGPFEADTHIHDKITLYSGKKLTAGEQQVMADMVRFKRTRTSMSKLHHIQVKVTAYSNKTSHGRHGPFQADTHIHE